VNHTPEWFCYYQVMGHCIARLDVAMFNAILRESANEIPSDPISDPIVDSRVLPIPAGDLSFGSGAQLKNSVWELVQMVDRNVWHRCCCIYKGWTRCRR